MLRGDPDPLLVFVNVVDKFSLGLPFGLLTPTSEPLGLNEPDLPEKDYPSLKDEFLERLKLCSLS